MTKRHRDFGKTKTMSDYEPLAFSLEGQEFECRPAINGATLLKFVADADSNEGGRSATALLDFFSRALKSEDAERFKALIDDPDTLIQIETIGEIAAWLVEQYTDRPTQEPSNSSSGSGRTGRKSTAASS